MRIHIMLIDDDIDENEILRHVFDYAGIEHKCTWALSVDHALSMLKYLDPDIIFIDLNMPTMDGLTGITKIRDLASLKDKPLVLYSTTITETVRQEAMRRGATACLQKPDSVVCYKEKILQVLSATELYY